MIKIDEKQNVHQYRKGETKTKDVGRLMHNPNVNGSPEAREPFIYIDGVCLTAGDCEEIAEWLRCKAEAYRIAQHPGTSEDKPPKDTTDEFEVGKFIFANLK